jgi:hypothetical protein
MNVKANLLFDRSSKNVGHFLMARVRLLLVWLAVFANANALATNLVPGRWEISVESPVTRDSGKTPQPAVMTQCLSANDAGDPSELIRSIAVANAIGCAYTASSYVGSVFRFSLECPGRSGMRATGSINFYAESFMGSFTSIETAGEGTVEFTRYLSARRLGGC